LPTRHPGQRSLYLAYPAQLKNEPETGFTKFAHVIFEDPPASVCNKACWVYTVQQHAFVPLLLLHIVLAYIIIERACGGIVPSRGATQSLFAANGEHQTRASGLS